ncbi:MAG TPA: hypothetical protein VFS18_05190, partial [Actinomycetota bacterium]|nr:hypothetical protein [Actinomycetota bacterium]
MNSGRINSLNADPRRLAARALFAALMALLIALVALPLGLSLAQTGPSIQIMNPHTDMPADGVEGLPQLSDKEMPFHLNAWVPSMPPSPAVEFQ